jgi:serine/threonine-protein kinase HipA
MGRLGVWMNGERVGTWSNDQAHVFDYALSWAESPRARPLSLSLPLTATLQLRGPVVEHYFDNLLPDNDAIRRRIRTRFGTRSADAFALLSAIGRDCVGAVQLLPPDHEPPDLRSLEFERVDEAGIERILREVAVTPTFGAQSDAADFRISIAGAQEKTALLRIEGAWGAPRGTTPTTHILKRPLGRVTRYDADFTTSVENEWLCAEIVRALGLPVAVAEMATFGAERALVVERFDRAWVADGARRPTLLRLPQEDFCQATGTPPVKRYESDGGPGIAKCLDILAASEQPAAARTGFALAQLAFWLLAAPDGHAKNFSLFIHRGGAFAPTPLYDILSAWPVIGKRARQLPYQEARMAMALRSRNAHVRFGEIEARHWRQLALVAAGEAGWSAMLALVEAVGPALERTERRLPADFPPQVWETVSAGMRRHADRFRAGLAHTGSNQQ